MRSKLDQHNYETHDWHMKKLHTRNRYGEQVYVTECKACGQTASEAMVSGEACKGHRNDISSPIGLSSTS